MPSPVGFCTKCGKDVESFDGLSACPFCGTKFIPCSYKDQVTVNINLHELRILCMWAERNVIDMKNEQEQANCADTVRAITGRLQKQLPENVVLLLSDELQQIKNAGFDVQTNFPTI